GVSVLVDELAESDRFFDRVEIRALQVFHESELERLRVVGFAHERGDLRKAGEAGCTPAPFSGNNLESLVAGVAHENRRENAVGSHRLRQRPEVPDVEIS